MRGAGFVCDFGGKLTKLVVPLTGVPCNASGWVLAYNTASNTWTRPHKLTFNVPDLALTDLPVQPPCN